jgi:microcystin-dependent protein
VLSPDVPDGYYRFTPELSGVTAVRVMALDSALLQYVGGAITQLCIENQWLAWGDSVADVVQAMFSAVDTWYSDMLIGSVFLFLSSLPPGWLALDGSTYDADDYPLLYDKLPAQLKTETDFTLPDMSGLFPLGTNTVGQLGDTGGASSVTLSVSNLPAHNHTYVPPTISEIDVEAPGAPIPSTGIGAETVTGNAGSGESFSIVNPYVKMIYAIFSGQYV